MPAKNAIKQYLESGIYHIYNRGVEKRKIFIDDQDYAVFLSYLKTYLLPKDEIDLQNKLNDPATNYKEKEKARQLLRLNNFADDITLYAYCLMPNHFHLLLKQNTKMGIDSFMESLETRYTMFFNKKHKRVGTLYQAVYKAVMVDNEEQLMYLTSYIHRNPLSKWYGSKSNTLSYLLDQPSSLKDYLGKSHSEWLHSEMILSYFSKTNPGLNYASFLNQTDDFTPIQNLTIDL